MNTKPLFQQMTRDILPEGKGNWIRRVAVYCRVSTLSEAQEESFETQCAAYRQRIEGDPTLRLVKIYGDQGISGATANRPQFQQLMKDCREGHIDVVMTKSISRFARNLADCMEAVRTLRELGIPVLFEREGIDTMSGSGEMLLAVLASIAQEEINSMSQNIRWSMEQNSSSGNPVTRTRYGYRKEIDGPNHKWIIFEPEARRVRFAFLKAEEGWDYREIAEGLAAMEEAEMTGVKWTRTRLARLLSNEAYIGHILTNKRVKLDYMQRFSMTNHGQRPQYYIEDHHAPIIDREQFERVGERVRNGKLRSKQRKGERKGGASYDS